MKGYPIQNTKSTTQNVPIMVPKPSTRMFSQMFRKFGRGTCFEHGPIISELEERGKEVGSPYTCTVNPTFLGNVHIGF